MSNDSQRDSFNPMKRFLLLWFIAAMLIAAGLGSLNVPSLYPLVRRGVKTTGTITVFEPNNHRTVHYFFETNGKLYSTSQQGGVDGEPIDASSVSTKHVVFCLPENSSVSCMGNPEPMLRNDSISIILAMLLFPPLALLRWRRQFPKSRRWLSADSYRAFENPPA